MKKLTQLQKNVLLLVFVMDFSYETVASIMTKKQSTFSWRLQIIIGQVSK